MAVTPTPRPPAPPVPPAPVRSRILPTPSVVRRPTSRLAPKLPGRTPPTKARKSRYHLSTPRVLMTFLVLLVLVATALGLVGRAAVLGQTSALRTIGDETAPDVASATDIAFSLADMDTNAANLLLIGERTDLGLTRADAAAVYEQRRTTVTNQLVQAAANARGGAERSLVARMLDDLGTFESHVARARLLSEQDDPAGALAAYTEATDIVHVRLLPAAGDLGRTNATELSRAHDEAREASSQRQAAVWVVGASLLGLLLAAQVVLARRVRRILNLGLLTATFLTVALIGGLGVVLRDSAEDLRAADEDAFASVLALSQARAVAYDANGDKSRSLLDPARAADHEAAFLDRTTQLVDLPGVTLETFDDRFRTAREQVAGGEDPRFAGHLGTALDNITFEGELDLALESLSRYAAYQQDDRRMRQLVASGDHAEAVRFTLSYRGDGSNGSFTRFDHALTQFRDLNQGRFEFFVARGSDRLAWWAVGALVTAALIVALCVLGLWWRLAEYRA